MMSGISPSNRRELIKVLMEGFGAFARNSASLIDVFVREDEELSKNAMGLSSLQDPMFVVKLIGDSRPDLIGRYILYSLKIADLMTQTRDIAKLSTEQKREAAKQFITLAQEVEAIGQEIEKN